MVSLVSLNPLKSGLCLRPWGWGRSPAQAIGLNPLKSGLCLRREVHRRLAVCLDRSQSPQIGALSPSAPTKPQDCNRQSVSIPSNRGSVSVRKTARALSSWEGSLNPLKSGLCLRLARSLRTNTGKTVSIPSNRGSVSVSATCGSAPMRGFVSIPSNRGSVSVESGLGGSWKSSLSLNPLKSGLCLRQCPSPVTKEKA